MSEKDPNGQNSKTPQGPSLLRALSLPTVVLYGLGVTVGAGIYVLLAVTVARAGIHAPLSFLLSAVVVAFSAASFSELAGRFPVSAGEAAFVEAGFGRAWPATLVGLLVVSTGVVSSAAIAIGSTGYLRQFLDLPQSALVLGVVLSLGAVAAWGIVESVLFASLFTLIEVGALIVVISTGVIGAPGIIGDIPRILPAFADGAAWAGVFGAGLLAFFAFIGFEDIVNLAEEVKRPRRTLPLAIFLSLGIATLIYMLLATVAVLRVPVEDLARADAPVSYVFQELTGMSPLAISLVAIVATLNGVVIQTIMASRVLYGLGRRGALPRWLATVHPRTRTPLAATGVVVAIVLTLALAFPLEQLAEMTSRIVLFVFALVNLALILIKRRDGETPAGATGFITWRWVPWAGVMTCAGMLIGSFVH